MKKRIAIACAAVVAIVGIVALILALNPSKTASLDNYNPQADENPFDADTGYRKPEIELDGKLDDDIWSKLTAITFGDTNSVEVKAFYGESGIYFGAWVTDDDLHNPSDHVYDNSSFELYVDATGKGGEKPETDHLQLFIDAGEKSLARRGDKGVWVDADVIKNYAVYVDGTLNDEQADKGYGVEVFIPYSQLGGESEVDYGVALGLVDCTGGTRKAWCGISGVDAQCPDTYFKFYRDTNTIEETRKTYTGKLNIDGKADDKEWAGRPVFTYGEGGRVDMRHYFDEAGAYFFFDVDDNKVCSEGSAPYLNDSVEIYLDVNGKGGKTPQTDDAQIRVDAEGHVEFLRGTGDGWAPRKNNTFAGAQVVDGKLNGTAKGYTVEVFVPWSDLEVEAAPKNMKASFGSVDWDGAKKADGGREITWSGIGTDPQVPDNYFKIDKEKVHGTANVGQPGGGEPVVMPNITLDGYADEAVWKNASVFTYTPDQKVNVRHYMDNLGLALFFEVNDDDVCASSSNIFENDGVEIYLDTLKNKGAKPQKDDYQIRIDASGNWECLRGTGEGWETCMSVAQPTVVVNGTLDDTKEDKGFQIEVYIQWKAIGLSEKPESLGINFGAPRSQESVFDGWEGTEADPQVPDGYFNLNSASIKR